MSRKVIFDDVFLSLSGAGISRVWTSVLTTARDLDLFQQSDLDLVLLNRSDQLVDVIDRRVDFPDYDFEYPATDRALVTKLCQAAGADAFISSYYTFALGVPSMMMVYDLIPERFGFDALNRGWLERQLAIAHSSRFVAISHSTKSDLLEFYPQISDDQVTVFHPGVDASVFFRRDSSATAEFKRACQLGDFLVCVGSRFQSHGYKNGGLVIDALSRGLLGDLDVVFVGGEEVTAAEADAAAVAGVRLVRLELDDEELAVCLSAASVLVYPSMYEGFGLPPVEALACGTPVVCVLSSSIPEAVGPLGLGISGSDPDELARQVARATSASWSSMIRRDGPRWAAQFGWEPMARGVVKAIDEAIEGRTAVDADVDAFLASYNRTAQVLQR